ncbi:hypothetical protein A2771_02640 [Candidatus Woesebacteria bacterium RIFCSPHIGHO2_01_FULL_38_26b]|uniref:Uncharacterized protein n=1 Tax=Candidatus Woesebacteria bacterium RIFCSPHIGHO2_01_FULL_38_26b TaxID=1802491 RepID=A0A1F7XW55_9BACT|nr:MAG: hypothetical protein A2771_02640 [Candidatus Woesebacteria bacterium RIFCSPHIGHO2_01_FULL_38_26b]
MSGKEILLDQIHFSPYVERLPRVNEDVKSVEKIDSKEILRKNGIAYKVTVETEDLKHSFLLGFIPDKKMAEKEHFGEHTISVIQPLKRYGDKSSIPLEKLKRLIDWWDEENLEGALWLALLHERDLCLVYEDIATAYLADALYDFVEEVVKSTPKVLKKMREMKLA